jgi:hypothetical protein
MEENPLKHKIEITAPYQKRWPKAFAWQSSSTLIKLGFSIYSKVCQEEYEEHQ